MNPREQRIMAAILAAGALFVFGWKALYVFAIAGIIYWIMSRRT